MEINGDEEVKKILYDIGIVKDWHKEYGDKEVSLKIVDNVEEAYKHINKYSSHHTDSIISENKENIEKYNIKIIIAPRIDISSTLIRERIKENKAFRYFLKDKVYNYIISNKLYL